MTTIRQYLEFVAVRIEEAENRGDKAEAVRLLTLVRETMTDAIRKIERGGN